MDKSKKPLMEQHIEFNRKLNKGYWSQKYNIK